MSSKKPISTPTSARSATGKPSTPKKVAPKPPPPPKIVEVFDPYTAPIARAARAVSFSPESSTTSHPCIIREILYAPPCPNDSIAKLLEVALTHHNTSHYQLAVQTYIKAQQNWLELAETSQAEMSVQDIIYFRMAIGNVYESCANDDLALAEYMEAKRYAEAGLPENHPDKALAYSAIGSVYIHMLQTEAARDFYAKCYFVRKELLSETHVDTAIVNNNIGVCWYLADNIKASMELFTKAFEVLKGQLGLSHPRTVLVQRNISLARTKFLKDFQYEKPEFRPIQIPVLTEEKKKEKPKGKGSKKPKKK